MAIDSDINNADAALNVEFFDEAIKNNYKSEKEGRPVFDDCVMIRIQIPGDSTSVVVRPAYDEDKTRFPMHWAIYANKQSDGSHAGTPVSEIPGITKSVVENLKAFRFYTIEQLSVASDQALQSLHMRVGMDPMSLRERCKRYLAHAKDGAAQTSLEQELAARDAKLAAMEGMMKQMQETLAAQQEMIALQAELTQGEEKAA